MITIHEITSIIGVELKDCRDVNWPITDFETMFGYVQSKHTAYFSANKETWWRELGRARRAPEGNALIKRDHADVGLIITEEYVDDLEHPIPQLIVKDSVKAFKQLAIHIRNQYTNPLIAITGSMGKSSTRMITSKMLQDYQVLENRGNNNIRAAMYSNMLKLIQNPDFAVIETSLNAINFREDTAVYMKPDIAVVTGVGAAHYSSFDSIEQIAEVKSRIFHGLSENGVAIINKDTLFVDKLIDVARSKTDRVVTYSAQDAANCDFAVDTINYQKGYTEISVNNDMLKGQFRLNTISNGMISNTLAALCILSFLDIDIKPKHLETFKPFPKILNMKAIQTPTHTATIIDDTHNASLPAMINAIEAFNTQTPFFTGNKVIALGKINDLGDKSEAIHAQLAPILSASNADYILVLDDDFRDVVGKVKGKHMTWYPTAERLMEDLLQLANEDSLTLLKSSSGGTTFPKMVEQLPEALRKYQGQYMDDYLFDAFRKIGQSYIVVDNETLQVTKEYNSRNSQTLEGLGPLFYYLDALNKHVENRPIRLGSWSTNDETYHTGLALTTHSLIQAMNDSPHPSMIYELADALYSSSRERDQEIHALLEQYDLPISVFTNLTGRYRVNERQSFSVHDLYNIFRQSGDLLFKYRKHFILGNKYKSGLIKGDKETVIFTNYRETETLRTMVNPPQITIKEPVDIDVSIIIPLYNRERRIARLLEKLAQLNYDKDKFEVIVVDDRSTDSSVQMAQSYADQFSHLRVIELEENSGGASKPRNEGIKAARGEWLLFIDSDDYITEDALKDAMEVAARTDDEMICLPYFVTKDKTRPISRSAFSNLQTVTGLKFEDTKLYNSLNVIGKLIKRDLVLKHEITFPEGIRVREDNWFLMQCYAMVDSIAILGYEKNYYYYEVQDEVALTNSGTPPRDAVKIYLAVYDFIMKQTDITYARKIDLLSIFLNRYTKMIQRGEYAPIRLFKHAKLELLRMLRNKYTSPETMDFIEELFIHHSE